MEVQKAKKSLSQNFLNDKNICKKIINICNLKNKKIIEIGPGYGFLTDFIIKENPKKIILIEKDDKIFKYLINKYSGNKKITIINYDILKVNLNIYNDYTIISNLPYNISTKIIIKLLKLKKNIKEMIFMIQKEVAIKFDYNISKANKYKFITKLSSDYKRCFDVPRTVFKPKPKINSSVVYFRLKDSDLNWNKIETFNKLIFSNKRKIIKNKLNMKNLNFIGEKRVDELSMEDLLVIYNSF